MSRRSCSVFPAHAGEPFHPAIARPRATGLLTSSSEGFSVLRAGYRGAGAVVRCAASHTRSALPPSSPSMAENSSAGACGCP